MTERASVLSAAILRAGLFAAVLAIVAGIFGMHVMTADHSSHTGHATVGPSAGHADASAGHPAGDAAVVHPAGQPALDAAFTASESCSSGCPGAQETGGSCVPSATTGSLTVVPPQADPAIHPGPLPGAGDASGYSYIPASPTPCELSISRT